MGPPPKVKIKLTVQRRIMIHLMDHISRIDDYEVPDIISQKGIGRELGLRQTHVSRALSELKREGLVNHRSSHIKGAGRKKKAYFLSRKGQEDVSDYLEEISKSNVPLRYSDGKLKLVSLEKAMDLISRSINERVSYHEIFNKYYDGAEFKMESSVIGSSTKDAPSEKALFGRDREISEIMEAIDDSKCKFISITGMAGMGKTALLGMISANLSMETISFITITEWTTSEKLLLDWSKMLSNHNRIKLWDLLRGSSGFDVLSSLEALIMDLEKTKSVIILDDLHKARSEINSMLDSLKDILSDQVDVTFIIGSRKKLDFINKKDIVVSKKVREIHLKNLDRDSSFKMLSSKGLSPLQVEKAYNSFKGHPLALEMYSISPSDIEEEGFMDFETYIIDEVLSKLSEDEMFVLKLAATYPRPISLEGLTLKEGFDRILVDGLCDKLLMDTLRDRRYFIHDSLRSVMRNSMTQMEYSHFIDLSIDFLSERGTEEDILHKLILLQDKNRKDELDKLVLEEGEMLIGQGHSQVLDLVRKIDSSKLKGSDLAEYHILRSYMSSGKKNKDPAWEHVDKAMAICDRILDRTNDPEMRRRTTGQVSRILYRRADLSRSRGRSDEIIKEYKRSLTYNRKYAGPEGVGKALNNLAMAYRDNGDLEKALDLLDESLEVLEGKGDVTSCAIIEVNKAEIHIERRDRSAAIKHLKRIDRFPVGLESVSGLLNKKIGICYKRMDMKDMAMSHLDKAYRSFNASRDHDKMIDTLCIASSIRGLGTQKRKSYVEKASQIYGSKKESISIPIKLTLLEGLISLEMDDAGIISQLMDDLTSTANVKRSLKIVKEKCIPFLDKALCIRLMKGLSKKAMDKGAGKAAVVLDIWTGELYLEKGDVDKANSELQQAMQLARRMRFEKAQKMIKRIWNNNSKKR